MGKSVLAKRMNVLAKYEERVRTTTDKERCIELLKNPIDHGLDKMEIIIRDDLKNPYVEVFNEMTDVDRFRDDYNLLLETTKTFRDYGKEDNKSNFNEGLLSLMDKPLEICVANLRLCTEFNKEESKFALFHSNGKSSHRVLQNDEIKSNENYSEWIEGWRIRYYYGENTSFPIVFRETLHEFVIFKDHFEVFLNGEKIELWGKIPRNLNYLFMNNEESEDLQYKIDFDEEAGDEEGEIKIYWMTKENRAANLCSIHRAERMKGVVYIDKIALFANEHRNSLRYDVVERLDKTISNIRKEHLEEIQSKEREADFVKKSEHYRAVFKSYIQTVLKEEYSIFEEFLSETNKDHFLELQDFFEDIKDMMFLSAEFSDRTIAFGKIWGAGIDDMSVKEQSHRYCSITQYFNEECRVRLGKWLPKLQHFEDLLCTVNFAMVKDEKNYKVMSLIEFASQYSDNDIMIIKEKQGESTGRIPMAKYFNLENDEGNIYWSISYYDKILLELAKIEINDAKIGDNCTLEGVEGEEPTEKTIGRLPFYDPESGLIKIKGESCDSADIDKSPLFGIKNGEDLGVFEGISVSNRRKVKVGDLSIHEEGGEGGEEEINLEELNKAMEELNKKFEEIREEKKSHAKLLKEFCSGFVIDKKANRGKGMRINFLFNSEKDRDNYIENGSLAKIGVSTTVNYRIFASWSKALERIIETFDFDLDLIPFLYYDEDSKTQAFMNPISRIIAINVKMLDIWEERNSKLGGMQIAQYIQQEACHELSHFFVNRHNQEFVSMMDLLMDTSFMRNTLDAIKDILVSKDLVATLKAMNEE